MSENDETPAEAPAADPKPTKQKKSITVQVPESTYKKLKDFARLGY